MLHTGLIVKNNMQVENNQLERLKEYFKSRDDVAFAFLYGSQAKGNATRLSDFDIAVYFYPRQRHPIEFEEEIYYDGENNIWGNLELILKKEVELLVLNRAPSIIASIAINSTPLAINDWGLYLDFMLIITDLADDFAEFLISDYKERNGIGKRDEDKAD